jgi:hypothetical protein
MKLQLVNLILFMVAACEAFAPTRISPQQSRTSLSMASDNCQISESISQRRAFLSNAALAVGAAAAAVSVFPQVAQADSMDDIQERSKIANEKAALAKVARDEKNATEKSNGPLLIGGVLGAGVVLALPFFGQNLARMAGVKNAKAPPKGKK